MAKSKSSFEEMLQEMRSKGLEIGTAAETIRPTESWSTGNVALDSIIGVGGLPIGKIIEFYGLPQSGKAQPLDSNVLTPHGYKRMGDIALGDWVMTPSGRKARVVGIFPQGVKEVFRVTMSDGTSCEATADHLWEVRKAVGIPHPRKDRPSEAKHSRGYNTVLTTSQIQEALAGEAAVASPTFPNKLYLPKVFPLDYGKNKIRYQINPYVMGVLLGDGTFCSKVALTNTSKELVERVRQLEPRADIKQISATTSYSLSKPEQSYRVHQHAKLGDTKNGFITAARNYNLWGKRSFEKFIPNDYKIGTLEQRKDLIRGMMDSDGTVCERGYASYTSTSKQLAQDFMDVVISVGWHASITYKAVNRYPYNGEILEGRPSWQVTVTSDEPPCFISKKVSRWKKGILYREDRTIRRIVTVEKVQDAEAQCILIDDPDHLYITDCMIPTHNTTAAVQTAGVVQGLIKEGKEEGGILFLDYEQALDLDYAVALGIDPDHPSFVYMSPTTLEEGVNAYRTLLNAGHVRLCIVDSVAGMISEKEAESETGAVTVADRAKALQQTCRQILAPLRRNRSSIIFLNHILEAINTGFGAQFKPKTVTPGGRAIPFYSSLRIEFQQKSMVKSTSLDKVTQKTIEQVDEVETVATVVKNKVAKPRRQATLHIRYGKGFSQPWSVFQVLVAHQVVTRKGAWYYVPDSMAVNKKTSFNGSEQVMEALESNPDALLSWTGAALKCLEEYTADTVTLDEVDEDGNKINVLTGEIL